MSLDQARSLAAHLRGRVRSVALMVDPSDADVQEVVEIVAPDFIQLHGNETPARVASIGALAGLPMIKALTIGESADTAHAQIFSPLNRSRCRSAKSSAVPGGTLVSVEPMEV